MSNLAKLEFVALDISGTNYLPWTLDAEIHLDAMDLGETIKKDNKASLQDRAKAMIFLRHHLHEGLKAEYLTVKDPYVLWQNLQERYDHQKSVILPKARYEWIHLGLQNFKTVSEYNSVVFIITSQLKLCGEKITEEDMLEKTYSTFHASNMLLQQQYRECGFKKNYELISCLLVAEQNNELLMKNHQSRPTGSEPFLEANGIAFPEANATFDYHGRGHGRRRGRGRGRERGHGHNNSWHYDGHNKTNFKKQENHDKWKDSQKKSSQHAENYCTRCGMKGHWQRACRTAKHLLDLYQASLNEKGKGVETNLAEHHNQPINTYLDCSNFFEDVSGNIDHLIGNGNIYRD